MYDYYAATNSLKEWLLVFDGDLNLNILLILCTLRKYYFA